MLVKLIRWFESKRTCKTPKFGELVKDSKIMCVCSHVWLAKGGFGINWSSIMKGDLVRIRCFHRSNPDTFHRLCCQSRPSALCWQTADVPSPHSNYRKPRRSSSRHILAHGSPGWLLLSPVKQLQFVSRVEFCKHQKTNSGYSVRGETLTVTPL